MLKQNNLAKLESRQLERTQYLAEFTSSSARIFIKKSYSGRYIVDDKSKTFQTVVLCNKLSSTYGCSAYSVSEAPTRKFTTDAFLGDCNPLPPPPTKT